MLVGVWVKSLLDDRNDDRSDDTTKSELRSMLHSKPDMMVNKQSTIEEQQERACATRLDLSVQKGASWRTSVAAGAKWWLFSWVTYLVVGHFFMAMAGVVTRDTLPTAAWPTYIFNQFDSGHFMRIAARGYFTFNQNVPNWDEAFFPGYPLVSRLLAFVVGLGHVTPLSLFVGMAVVSWLGSLVAAVLILRLAGRDRGRQDVEPWPVGVLLFGPYAVFLMASYSESLFLALALGAWLAGRQNRWWCAALLAGFAGLVRINGLFLVAGLVVMAMSHSQVAGHRIASRVGVLAAALLAPLGYFTYLHGKSGSWSTWLHTQRSGWGRGTVFPWTAAWNSVARTWRDSSTTAERFQSSMELVFVALMLLGIWVLIQRRKWPELTYVSLTAASLLTSTIYLSIPRSMLLCFPFIVLAGQWFGKHLSTDGPRRTRIVARLIVAAGLVLSMINTATFVSHQWTG